MFPSSDNVGLEKILCGLIFSGYDNVGLEKSLCVLIFSRYDNVGLEVVKKGGINSQSHIKPGNKPPLWIFGWSHLPSAFEPPRQSIYDPGISRYISLKESLLTRGHRIYKY